MVCMPDWFAVCIAPARFRTGHADSRPQMDLPMRLGTYVDRNTALASLNWFPYHIGTPVAADLIVSSKCDRCAGWETYRVQPPIIR